MANDDIQRSIDLMNAAASASRAKYHMTYGQLVDFLKVCEPGTKMPRVSIGSYRGFYIDIAIFTEDGVHSEAFNADGHDDMSAYDDDENRFPFDMPHLARDAAAQLESLYGKCFDGYKGGMFKITKDTPLWLEKGRSYSSDIAITGAEVRDNVVSFFTKAIE